jgi:bla regulator protein blaR1
MNNLVNWLSPSTMHSLGWTLLHFLWQGTAVAALAAVLLSLCRRSSVRYAVAVGALAFMLTTPIVTFVFLVRSPASVAVDSYSALQTWRTAPRNIAAPISSSILPFASSFSLDALPWLVEGWLLGVAFFSLRSAGGFLLLERERRKQSKTVSDRVLAMCQTLQRRLGLNRTIGYCECEWLQAPAVLGWFRPVVLLPVTAVTGLSEEQLQSIIAHELAHIQRFDAFVNAFQVAVETLLFYHPAVWWLNRRIRTEREHCCDDTAVSLCGNPIEYARALTIMEEWRSAPALAMAANRGPLSARVFRVLGLKSVQSGTRNLGLAGGILCLTAAVAAGNTLLGIAYPKMHVGAVSATNISLRTFAFAAASQQTSGAAPATAPSPAAKPSPAHPQTSAKPASSGSYVEEMKAAGLGDLTVDQLIELKIQDVTPEYVRGLHEQGLHPDADTLVAMRIQGVTPEYVRDLRALGLNPDTDQLVAMKIQGVDAAYVRGLKDAGIQADADELVAMRIQGVTPESVRGLHEQGLQPDADELVAMRIQGVTADYVRDIHALDLRPAVDQFIAMKIQGVTPEYIKGLQAAGLTFSVDDVIRAKIQQITREFIEKAVKHGFKNLTLDKLLELKHVGILESTGEI